jgi:hypothetical protein
VLLLLPFEFVFGHAREGYISAVAVLYVVPAAFAAAQLAFLATQGNGSGRENNYYQLTLFRVLAILFPPFWTPTLRGYPDIVGILLLAIAGYVVLRSDIGKFLNVKKAILLGVLLWLPFLFRKWYAYTIMAFFVSAFCFSLYTSLSVDARYWRNIVLRISGFYAISGIVLVLFAFLVQYQFAVRAFTTSYSDIFAAWQVSAPEHFIAFLEYFGPVWILVAAVGLIAPLITGRGLAATSFVALNLIFTVIFFTHTQAFGMHHYLPVALWLYVLGCMGISQLAAGVRGVKRTVAICCSVGLAGAVFYGTYGPLPAWSSQVTGVLLPFRLARIKLENYSNYQRFLADLDGVMKRDDTFSVYGSSNSFSDSLIHALSGSEMDRGLVYASQVDRRDHFDVRSLLTKFVLVADPIQIHLSEETQHVITEPANRILMGFGIGRAYDRRPGEYELAGGVKAYIFEKKRVFTIPEVNELFAAFFGFYPEWRRESYLKKLFLVANITLGDKVGLIYPETAAHPDAIDELVVRPGETTETRLRVENWELFLRSYSALEMFIPERFSACSGAKGAGVEISVASQKIWRGSILPGQMQRVAFPPDLVGLFELNVHTNGSAACDELHVKFLDHRDLPLGE